MKISISNYKQFINSIYDFIIEKYSILPREFVFSDKYTIQSAIYYDEENDKIIKYNCLRFGDVIHPHDDLIFCSEPEIIAVLFIAQSVFGKVKIELIKTLKEWVPFICYNFVEIEFKNDTIYSNLFPQLVYKFLDAKTRFSTCTYFYIINSSVDYKEEIIQSLDKKIIIMPRAKTTRKRTKSRSRSRSRSRSPNRRRGVKKNTKTNKRAGRSRSRSRSRSSSRSRSRSRSRSASK